MDDNKRILESIAAKLKRCIPTSNATANSLLTSVLVSTPEQDPEVRAVLLFQVEGQLRAVPVLDDAFVKTTCDMLLRIVDNERVAENLGKSFLCIVELIKQATHQTKKKSKSSTTVEAITEIVQNCCRDMCTRLLDTNAKSLSKRLTDGESARDAVVTGMMKLIETMHPHFGGAVVKGVMEYLLTGMKNPKDNSLRSQSLTLLAKVLAHFVSHLSSKQTDDVIETLWTLSESNEDFVSSLLPRCFGHISSVCDPSTLEAKVLQKLDKKLEEAVNDPTLDYGLYNSMLLEILSSCNGSSVEENRVKDFVRVQFTILNMKVDTDSDDEETVERTFNLIAAALRILAKLIEQCPHGTNDKEFDIISKCIDLIGFDPYVSEDEDGASSKTTDDPYSFSDSDDDGYSDGDSDDDDDTDTSDDNSWKVRKAAIDTIHSIVTCRPTLLKEIYKRCCESLIKQFADSVDDVAKAAILCFKDMLRASLEIDEKKDEVTMLGDFPAPPMLRRVKSATEQLNDMIANQTILKAANDRLKHAKHDTRACIMSMLQVFFIIMKKKKMIQKVSIKMLEDLCERIKENFLVEAEALLKLEALKLLDNMCATLDVKNVLQCLVNNKRVAQSIFGLIKRNEDNSVKEHAFRTLERFFKLPELDCSSFAMMTAKKAGATVKREGVLDSVRLAAISLSGYVIGKYGDLFDSKVQLILDQIYKRMDMETFTLACLRVFEIVTKKRGAHHLAFLKTLESKVIKKSLMSGGMVEGNLQIARIDTLAALVNSLQDKMLVVKKENICQFKDLISERSTLAAQAVINLALEVQKVDANATEDLMPKCLMLLCGDILHERRNISSGLFNSLRGFIREQVKRQKDGMRKLMQACWNQKTTRNTMRNLALVTADCLLDTKDACLDNVKQHIISKINSSKTPESKALATLILGNVGLGANIWSSDVEKIVLDTASMKSDLSKSATADAFGKIVLGDIDTLLPKLLGNKQLDDVYRALALKSILATSVENNLKIPDDSASELLTSLFEMLRCGTNKVKEIMLGCGGLLLTVSAKACKDELIKYGFGGDKTSSSTQLACLKAFNDAALANKQTLLEITEDDMATLLNMSELPPKDKPKDTSADVDAYNDLANTLCARVNLLQKMVEIYPKIAQSYIARTKDCMDNLVGCIVHRKSLIVEIDLGQMKIKTDYGKDLRVAALRCIGSMLRNGFLRNFFNVGDLAKTVYLANDKQIRKSASNGTTEAVVAGLELLINFMPFCADVKDDLFFVNPKKGIWNRLGRCLKMYKASNDHARIYSILREIAKAIKAKAMKANPQEYAKFVATLKEEEDEEEEEEAATKSGL